MGRPRKDINKKMFEKLCALQCTKIEICSFLEISDKTLDRWCHETYEKSFSEVFRIKREAGKISLRRMQFTLAEKNSNMAIFLGKNYLGQSNEPNQENKNKIAEEWMSAVLGENEDE